MPVSSGVTKGSAATASPVTVIGTSSATDAALEAAGASVVFGA